MSAPISRDLEIAFRYEGGESLARIGESFGISKQRVFAIVRVVGAPLRCPQRRPGRHA